MSQSENKLIEMVQVGGSVETAKLGQYQIDIKAVLAEAWQQTKLTRTTFMLSFAVVFAVVSVVLFFVDHFVGGFAQLLKQPEQLSAVQLLITVVSAPFLAAMEMMAVLNAIGLSIKADFVFKFFRRSGFVVLASLICGLLAGVGFNLLILPGLFVLVCTSLINPLIIEKKYSPIQALILSFQALRFQWLKLLAIFGVLFMVVAVLMVLLSLPMMSELMLISLVVSVVVLSYLIPMFFHVKGILYRDIFGLQLAKIPSNKVPAEDVFRA